MEDLTNSLDTYKVQLTQVQAALTLDPENDELLKLQQDLEEVVQLTLDLISNETQTHDNTDVEQTVHVEPSVPASSSGSTNAGSSKESQTQSDWKAGDSCLAFKESDGSYHQAVVEDILPESETVAVTFVDSHTTEVCQLSSLKHFHISNEKSLSKANSSGQESDTNKNISKKELQIKRQEYRKKKNLKKKMRLKEKEAESEIKKNKWKDFNQKAFQKSSKGKVKKSIFASPEGVGGKVGIGTCGVADKKMTKYEHGAKYNARHLIPR